MPARFPAFELVHAVANLNRTSHDLALATPRSPDTRPQLKRLAEAVELCERNLSTIPRSPTLEGLFLRLKSAVAKPEAVTYTQPHVLAREFLFGLATELHGEVILTIAHDKRRLYLDPVGWFEDGKPVLRRFPAARSDIAGAGQCFALDQWNAAVFHSMCVLDHGLVKLSKTLKATPPPRADWHKLIGAIEQRIQSLRTQPASPKPGPLSAASRKTLERYSEAAVQFRHFKDAWRNHTMHGRAVYDEVKAREVLNAVKYFMRAIC